VEVPDLERARAAGAAPLRPVPRVTLEGRPVLEVEVPVPGDAPGLRERLRKAGVACHEADVRFAMRYLIDRGIKGSLTVRGPERPGKDEGVDVVFDEPEVEPGEATPRLRVLSIDIETDPRARKLLSVALVGAGASEVLLLTPPGAACPGDARPFATEKALLEAFLARVRALDPDVITGWNVVDFDLAVLARLASAHRLRLDLGRGPGGLRFRDAGGRGARQAQVPGRLVLDGIHLLRGAFVRMDDYGLDAVAREVLGEGKTLHGPGRAAEVLRLFEEDRPRLVEYNRKDAQLVLDILDRLQLVELAIARSRLTGMPLDRVSSSVAAFDFLYLVELGRRGVVAPSVSRDPPDEVSMEGGHVLEPLPGLHENVVVLDFKSLYPSLIRTFEIDPLGLHRGSAPPGDAIVAPNGAAFDRRPGILTGILDEIMPRRDEAKRAGDAVKSHAIKILMNSFYGCLGTPASRFFDPRLANAITAFGREVLLFCRGRLEALGYRVLYGDTDSLFVASGAASAQAAHALGRELAARLSRELAAHVEAAWRVTSRLELRFDRLYLRLLLPAVRHGTAGARKRYAGLVDEGERRVVAFTGMEAVRGDWTDLAKEVQRGLYARLFADQPVEDYLRGVIAEVRAGRLDDRLVYRKALRKAPSAYTATTPPHVAAARKMGRITRGRVAYVVTVAGPEPAEERRSPIDHAHYVEKQVRPVAEPVLSVLGLDFDRLSGAVRQLSLFD
jgi:DNA polymerase-2